MIPSSSFNSRQIDFTGWDLVFTTEGRYYFLDTVEGVSKWRPPPHLLEYLQEMPPEQLETLFNPKAFWSVDAGPVEGLDIELDGELGERPVGELDDKDDYIRDTEDESQHETPPPVAQNLKPTVPKRPPLDPEAQKQAVDNFKEMFLGMNDLDPFASWDSLKQRVSSDPRFLAIVSDRERKALFDSICPILAEKARKAREAARVQAEHQWNEILGQLTLARALPTWTEFSRTVKKESFYRILDSKIMEKQYRDRLSNLRSRSAVYQIPK